MFIPYIMLIIQWKRIGNFGRTVGIIWSLFTLMIGIGGVSSDEQQALTTTTEPVQTIAPITKQEPVPTETPVTEQKTEEKADTIKQVKEDGVEKDQEYDVIIDFPEDKYPETAAHIKKAIENGESAICTIDRNGADGNRDESLNGIPTKDGYDRDEFPMAMCAEGGEGADIAYVTPSDNRGAGSWVGNQLEGYTDGTRVLFVIDGGKSGSISPATKVVPKAVPKPTTTPTEKPSTSSNVVYYKNCTAVKEAGAAPIYKGDAGYSSKLDRDGDGVACEK